jgi:hypothetical protein
MGRSKRNLREAAPRLPDRKVALGPEDGVTALRTTCKVRGAVFFRMTATRATKELLVGH